MRKKVSLVLLLFIITGCFASSAFGKKASYDQLQLQEEIQRFYTRFTERVVETFLNSRMEQFHFQALKQYTLYDSEALKIATAPYPAINLLDMMVFIKLNRVVIRRYWVPQVYGKVGIPLYNAFDESDKDLTRIAAMVLSKEEIFKINQSVYVWLKKHPKTVRVEKIRTGDFSKYAREAGNGTSFSLTNLIIDTKSAATAVDQAVLVSNRAIFLAQYMPFILRLQARIGFQEVLNDTVSTLQGSHRLIKELNDTQPLVQNLSSLAINLNHLAVNSKSALSTMHTSFPAGINVHKAFSQIDALITKTTGLLQQIEKQKNGEIKEDLTDLMSTAALLLIAVGVCTSLAWWIGYYISKRLLKRFLLKRGQ